MTKKPNGEDSSSIIHFPCDFNIKIMGKSSDGFVKLVENIVREHFPHFSNQQLSKRFSQFTNYMSITVTVHAESQEQLDNLYRQLSSTPEILIVL